MNNQEYYKEYIKILEEELVVAQGCTEPIAVAYATALATEGLKGACSKIKIMSSGNIIKNAKSVVVPNTNGLKGMQASALAGMVGGKSKLGLEVLSDITREDIVEINKLISKDIVTINKLDTPITLHLIVKVYNEQHSCEVELKHMHTNVTRLSIDGVDQIISQCDENSFNTPHTDRSILSVSRIIDFVENADIEDYRKLLEQQIIHNIAIAKEGLLNDYGVGVGKSILASNQTLENKIKAYAAAGSDARMSGSTLPVVTNSGSGNQGMTCSIPVIIMAQEMNVSSEKMLKALLLSNLITIHIKTGITRLSSYCGAIVAATGSAAGFAYLNDATTVQIENTITNILGNISGVICDGAKESCPSKIASGLDAAFQAWYLAKQNKVYSHGCGIVNNNIEKTIINVGILGSVGMKETDQVILDIMTGIKN